MSDHIPDLTKMIGETPRTDLMEQHAPVGLRRNAAFEQSLDLSRQLERELTAANERIRLLIAERDTARRQADQNYKLREEFTDLLGTDDVEQGVAVVRKMKQRIKRLEGAMSEIAYAASHPLGAGQSLTLGKIESIALKAKEGKP